MLRWYIENSETFERRDITAILEDSGSSSDPCPEYDGHAYAMAIWPEADPANLDCYAKEVVPSQKTKKR